MPSREGRFAAHGLSFMRIRLRRGVPERAANGCADNMSGTSEVPQLAAPLCATPKSAEMGHQQIGPVGKPTELAAPYPLLAPFQAAPPRLSLFCSPMVLDRVSSRS
jgi:hypothetical protein